MTMGNETPPPGNVLALPDLRIRADGTVPVVNSRNVAEVFEKEHRNVLRDIAGLEIGSDLSASWFRPVTSLDSYGREQPSYDMTRDGFSLLAFGWTGERAKRFQVAYIRAFNEMEARLASNNITGTDLIAAIREIVAPLAIRHDGHDRAIERVVDRVDNLAVDVCDIKRTLAERERRITKPTKEAHMRCIQTLGGRCPCCGMAELINAQGERMPFVEFDHFYRNSYPDFAHTWPLCKPCHTGFTTARVARTARLSEFSAYHEKCRRLPGRQITLFG